MKKRAMKKWIPTASCWCEDCKLLVISPDIDGYKYAKCKYCNKVWLYDSPNKMDVDDSKRCNVHESEQDYAKARLKNVKILSELYKGEQNKFVK